MAQPCKFCTEEKCNELERRIEELEALLRSHLDQSVPDAHAIDGGVSLELFYQDNGVAASIQVEPIGGDTAYARLPFCQETVCEDLQRQIDNHTNASVPDAHEIDGEVNVTFEDISVISDGERIYTTRCVTVEVEPIGTGRDCIEIETPIPQPPSPPDVTLEGNCANGTINLAVFVEGGGSDQISFDVRECLGLNDVAIQGGCINGTLNLAMFVDGIGSDQVAINLSECLEVRPPDVSLFGECINGSLNLAVFVEGGRGDQISFDLENCLEFVKPDITLRGDCINGTINLAAFVEGGGSDQISFDVRECLDLTPPDITLRGDCINGTINLAAFVEGGGSDQISFDVRECLDLTPPDITLRGDCINGTINLAAFVEGGGSDQISFDVRECLGLGNIVLEGDCINGSVNLVVFLDGIGSDQISINIQDCLEVEQVQDCCDDIINLIRDFRQDFELTSRTVVDIQEYLNQEFSGAIPLGECYEDENGVITYRVKENLNYAGAGFNAIHSQVGYLSRQLEAVHTEICSPPEKIEYVSIVAAPQMTSQVHGVVLVLDFVRPDSYLKVDENGNKDRSKWRIQIPNPKEGLIWDDLQNIVWQRGSYYCTLKLTNYAYPVKGYFASEGAANLYFDEVLKITKELEVKRTYTKHVISSLNPQVQETKVYTAYIARVNSNTGETLNTICIKSNETSN